MEGTGSGEQEEGEKGKSEGAGSEQPFLHVSFNAM